MTNEARVADAIARASATGRRAVNCARGPEGRRRRVDGSDYRRATPKQFALARDHGLRGGRAGQDGGVWRATPGATPARGGRSLVFGDRRRKLGGQAQHVFGGVSAAASAHIGVIHGRCRALGRVRATTGPVPGVAVARSPASRDDGRSTAVALSASRRADTTELTSPTALRTRLDDAARVDVDESPVAEPPVLPDEGTEVALGHT